MKKLIICLLVAITLTNCEVGVEMNAEFLDLSCDGELVHKLKSYKALSIGKGMTYMVLVPFDGGPANN